MEYLTGLELLLNWFNDVVFPRVGMSFPSFFINPRAPGSPRKDVKMPRELALKISKVCSKPGTSEIRGSSGSTYPLVNIQKTIETGHL